MEFQEINKEVFGKFSKTEGNLDKDFIDVLKMVAPGTSLRIALDDLLRAKMGALVVFDNGKLDEIVEGGFKINSKFSSQKLVEVAKMDGAIILSKDAKEILAVNTMLYPDVSIITKETGTRHKSAERTARQSGTIVIAVSERKNKISLFYGSKYYQLEMSSEVLRRASETLQILEKQREVFNERLDNLNSLELRGHATVKDICLVLQKIEIIKKIAEIVNSYLIELGKEGMIVKMRLRELMNSVLREEELILKDYFQQGYLEIFDRLEEMDFDSLLEPMNLSEILFKELHNKKISPKGLRILEKTNLTERHVDLLLGNFENLNKILYASKMELFEVLEEEEIVEFFREEIYNLRERINFGKTI